MTGLVLSIVVGFGQGVLHGLGPDHCAAVATLGLTRSAREGPLWVALRFAVGHAVVLGALAAAFLGLGIGLSERFERWAEVLAGGVLLALASLALLWPSALSHGHPYLGGHVRDHHHPKATLAAGALMAVSGLRSLMLSLPPLLVGGALRAEALAYLPAFALGILCSMGALGLALSALSARASAAALQVGRRATALGTAALGLGWMAARL
jgi:nickel/cobalt transporter (NicO) family protein